MTTERALAAAYDEVARLLNYEDGGQEVLEVLDDCAEEADDNGLTPDEKKRNMLLTLNEVMGSRRPLALRAATILNLGYEP